MTVTTSATRVLDNYIGGSWTPAAATEQLDVTNPATGEVLARVPLSSATDLDAAVQAARAALPVWRDVSVIARARKLFALREGLDGRREDLARSVTTEMGKTLPDARAEVARMIEMVEAACAIPTTMQGRVLEDVSRGIDAETIRQPVGVCAAIVPFNFPAMVPFWFLPFAIGCGNTFILKPSEQVPLTQQIAFEVLDSLELPPGVVNLVNGGRAVVEGILDHPGIDAVSFVGSAPVAKIVYERSAKAGKRVQALGGAKNHMVVMPDAVVDKTVSGIIGSAFGAAGQRCMAGSVVVTVGEAHERLLPALRDAAEAVRLGDGLDEQNELGPVVSEAARERILAAVERGVDEGAELVVDGRDPGLSEGSFIGATILDKVTPEMELAREEIFGPVLSLIHVDTLDEAIDAVNSEPLRQRRLDLHRVRRCGPQVQARRRGRDGGREHRRRGSGRVLPVQRLEGQLPRRPARPRHGRGGLLHAQEDHHVALLLEWRVRQLLRRDLKTLAHSRGFREGLRVGAPFAVAGGILAASFGILADEAGFSDIAAVIMSAIVFAGSAQFTAISILAQGGGAGAAVAAAALMNSRFLPMSAAVGPSFSGGPIRRALKGQAVVDHSWALSSRGDGTFDEHLLLGASAIAYATWVSGTAAGALWGDVLGDPDALGLDAIFPAFFFGLLLNEIKSRRARGVAALGTVIALALVPFTPPGIPVLVASLASLVGLTRGARAAVLERQEAEGEPR